MGLPTDETLFEGHRVDAVVFEGDVWFLVEQVEGALGYQRGSLGKLVRSHWKGLVRDDAHYEVLTGTRLAAFKVACRNQDSSRVRVAHLLVLTERGLYRVLTLSRKPAALRFQDWLEEQVLPSIARTGRYETPAAIGARPHRALPGPTAAPPAPAAFPAPDDFGQVLQLLELAREGGPAEAIATHLGEQLAIAVPLDGSREAKRLRVRLALMDPSVCTWTSRAIAQLMGVSLSFVRRRRDHYELRPGERLTEVWRAARDGEVPGPALAGRDDVALVEQLDTIPEVQRVTDARLAYLREAINVLVELEGAEPGKVVALR